MVNQLLAMARVEDKEQALRMQDVDLAALTRETVLDFVPRALDKSIDLGYEGPADGETGARLRGQPVLLRELVRNLVDNALQYTSRGGTVTARVTRDPSGRALILEVEDNGPGIAPDERALVWRPFYRALGSEVDGSGLGLAIVQEIAQHHDAEISIGEARARSPAGLPGALFTVRFPLDAGSAPALPRAP
jgi:two-component system sensor histidine kinase TctE